MARSRRALAIADLIERLSFIQKEKGYSCDAGLLIFGPGEVPELGPKDPPEAIAVVIGPDEGAAPAQAGGGYTHGRKVTASIPLVVQAIVQADQDSETPLWERIEELIADIKVAVEIEGNDPPPNEGDAAITRMFAGGLPKGLTRGQTVYLTREKGSEFAGAAIEYRIAIQEEWGRPWPQ